MGAGEDAGVRGWLLRRRRRVCCSDDAHYEHGLVGACDLPFRQRLRLSSRGPFCTPQSREADSRGMGIRLLRACVALGVYRTGTARYPRALVRGVQASPCGVASTGCVRRWTFLGQPRCSARFDRVRGGGCGSHHVRERRCRYYVCDRFGAGSSLSGGQSHGSARIRTTGVAATVRTVPGAREAGSHWENATRTATTTLSLTRSFGFSVVTNVATPSSDSVGGQVPGWLWEPEPR